MFPGYHWAAETVVKEYFVGGSSDDEPYEQSTGIFRVYTRNKDYVFISFCSHLLTNYHREYGLPSILRIGGDWNSMWETESGMFISILESGTSGYSYIGSLRLSLLV